MNQIFWQSHENGSDGTVRISAGNLNYRFLAIDQTAKNPALAVKKLNQAVPHLVLSGVSHTGDNGILGGNPRTMTTVYPHIKEALSVAHAADYQALAANWQNLTGAWNAAHPDDCNATVVFSLKHPGGRSVADSLILIKDDDPSNAQSIMNVGSSMEPRQPIQNATTPSSVSFYVNYANFIATYPHTIEIQVNSGCAEISYPAAIYTVLADQTGSVRPNEFIYVKVTLDRQSVGAYEVIPVSQNPDVHQTWPPLPQPQGP